MGVSYNRLWKMPRRNTSGRTGAFPSMIMNGMRTILTLRGSIVGMRQKVSMRRNPLL